MMNYKFQHTAARRRLGAAQAQHEPKDFQFQHTAARRRLDTMQVASLCVSISFNTQPPEGGWVRNKTFGKQSGGFNTQPPEGGWAGNVSHG